MKAVRSEIVEPYAEALMSIAKDNDLTEKIGEDMSAILNLLGKSSDFRDFLNNPIIKAESKKNVLQQVLGSEIQAYTLNILQLLVDRRRSAFIEPLCQQYRALLRAMNQTVLAQVTSAVPLTESQMQSVQGKVKGMTQAREVELETKIDPDIIGGVIIKVGSQVLDASLRGQLRRLGLRLNSAK
ncbi:ATP synthase F1 subunit delta [Merismopedia glauca]|uniref:ATP synthase subunit delta n=1 Tax=Merismopedia glauca CCAP 1448/3 TaxID=1296344 RepID=A0A2T1BZ08_9CYAN|nr:ATP synthase F1 subunit delta [Merismopedia glauca]PSB01251.1 F0F1 ATP synthase subunit delta [Merismopedia glauca CCAP 1448/3]